jgi:hypothetical protein
MAYVRKALADEVGYLIFPFDLLRITGGHRTFNTFCWLSSGGLPGRSPVGFIVTVSTSTDEEQSHCFPTLCFPFSMHLRLLVRP